MGLLMFKILPMLIEYRIMWMRNTVKIARGWHKCYWLKDKLKVPVKNNDKRDKIENIVYTSQAMLDIWDTMDDVVHFLTSSI